MEDGFFHLLVRKSAGTGLIQSLSKMNVKLLEKLLYMKHIALLQLSTILIKTIEVRH